MQGEIGAAAGAARPDITLRDPTFADWLKCGDISRQTIVNPRATSGEVAIEFRVNSWAVVRWFEALSGQKADALRTIPLDQGRRAFQELQAKVPAFDAVKPDGRAEATTAGLVVPIKHALPGFREQHSVVTLRYPEIGDWIDCGDLYVQRALEPGSDNEPGALETKLDERAVGAWMQRLSGLPFPVLSQMAYEDARQVFAALKPLIREANSGN